MTKQLSLGQKIEMFRVARKWSAAELGRKIGVRGETVRSWETGKTVPNEGYRLSLVRVLPELLATPPQVATQVKKPILNRIAFVLDKSGSMSGLTAPMMERYRSTLLDLRRTSISTGQRIDVMTVFFASDITYGPSFNDIGSLSEDHIRRHTTFDVYAAGCTVLRDAVSQVITSLENGLVLNRESYDISYLVNVLTDGEESGSRRVGANEFVDLLRRKQATDVWTFSFQVPNGYKKATAQRFGIPEGNVIEWEQTTRGIENTSIATSRGFDSYFTARSNGQTKSTSFYTNLADKNQQQVKKATELMDNITDKCKVLSVTRNGKIRDIVESKGIPFKKGTAFYQLTKTELKVQPYKKIILTKIGGSGIFCGTTSIRNLLGLPSDRTVKITPQDHGEYEIFVQSTSVNRNLSAGTKVVYYPNAA